MTYKLDYVKPDRGARVGTHAARKLLRHNDLRRFWGRCGAGTTLATGECSLAGPPPLGPRPGAIANGSTPQRPPPPTPEKIPTSHPRKRWDVARAEYPPRMDHPKKTRSRRKRPSFLPPPPLPDFLQGMAGRIEVKQIPLVGYSRDQIGEWDTRKRRISVLRSLSPGVKWYVLAHEFAHSAGSVCRRTWRSVFATRWPRLLQPRSRTYAGLARRQPAETPERRISWTWQARRR
jgi:hypothetical protein